MQPELRDEECSTEIVATIAGGYAEDHSTCLEGSASKSQEVLTAERITMPTMMFGGEQGLCFTSSYNNPLAVEMKVASAIVWGILINMGSLADIITWDYLKKLTNLGRGIVPLVHPILGFGGLEVNPTGMIRLRLHFGDNVKAKNLEMHFLVVNVSTAYNVILGRPTLHRVKEYKHQQSKRNTKRSKALGALEVFIMITALGRPSYVTFMVRCRGFGI
ncbi:hypothetical protein Cgig2_007596 [Carnegiea gigantea]|uniref:Uncharacterized protein n=1 Tax=Carnegiea gigantea TaxID=171969 RepID=A0A9Q1Q6T0_9CARY|nr:hypothetical protein Cgig2_007596 [Carnegiea gigantea]